MSNYRRWRVEGGTYFFTVVTHQRQPFLTDRRARRILRQAFEEVRGKRPFSVDAIVLLPDHLHSVWTLPRGDSDYSTRWNQIKGAFTRHWLTSGGCEAETSDSRQRRRERGVWQRRLYEHTIRDGEDLGRCLDYLHVNPLKHGLVERVIDWPWSSFHRYVKEAKYDPGWGSADEWYGDEWNRFE